MKGLIVSNTFSWLILLGFFLGACETEEELSPDRDTLFKKLKNKYKINASYDPCSYPGIQCKYKVKGNDNINYELFNII